MPDASDSATPKDSEGPLTGTGRPPQVDVNLDAPKDWYDRSMIVYACPEPDAATGLDANIVVGRDAIIEGETFPDYLTRQRDTLAMNCPDFALISERQGRVKEFEAGDLNYRWSTPQGAVRQRVVFLFVRGGVVSFTATAAPADFEKREAVFNQALSDLSIMVQD